MSQVSAEPEQGVSLAMLVQQLVSCRPELFGDGGCRVTGVFHDSRQVRPGGLYVARRGAKFDGLDFLPGATEAGAVAVLVGRDQAADLVSRCPGLPVVSVQNVELGLALASEIVYGWPSRSARLIGVTGTNGKTTLVWLIASILERLGIECGQIGTLGFRFGDTARDGSLTTPEADDLSRALAAMRDAHVGYVAMEVSNVALVQQRVAALEFDVAAFTNFSRDHIDFHGTLEAYREAKSRLFTERKPRRAVINVEDPVGVQFASMTAAEVFRVGRGGQVDASGLQCTERGIEGPVVVAGVSHAVYSPLVGAHNVENLSVALGVLLALDVDISQVAAQLPHVTAPPGRLERCDGPEDDCTVLVDYAHTPDALASVLDAVRAITANRIICVFGCGGDRDPGKRPLMGRAVAERADCAVLTSDNPRTEDPARIADQVQEGLLEIGATFARELDRAVAIEKAIEQAESGDWVVIAGKGHETYQQVGSTRLEFDDRVHARRALQLRRGRMAERDQ